MATETPLPPILLLIDLQQGLVEGPPSWGGRSTPNLVENVTYLLKTWRSKNWPILHVQHDDIFDASNPIAAIHPETYPIHPSAAPLPGEPVFVKNVGSPFVASGLRQKVDEIMAGDGDGPEGNGRKGKRKIVVIGMDGAQCINDTTRNATDLGYKTVVVGDASASYGMEDWKTGKQRGAEETHNAAMDMLVGYTDGKVTTTAEPLTTDSLNLSSSFSDVTKTNYKAMDGQQASHPTTYAYSNPHYPEFYDLYIRSLFGTGPSQDAIPFAVVLSTALAKRQGQDVKVVEIGTGTGRIIKDLLNRVSARGIDGELVKFVGVDHSSSMLERAKRTTEGLAEVKWVRAPASSFVEHVPELEGDADLLIFAAGGISHLTADGEVLEFLRQVKRALRDRGSVAIVSVLHEFIPCQQGCNSVGDQEVQKESEVKLVSEQHPGLMYVKSPTSMSWSGHVRTDRFVVKGVREKDDRNREKEVWEQEMVWSLRMFDEKMWEQDVESAGLVIGGVTELEIQRLYFLKTGPEE